MFTDGVHDATATIQNLADLLVLGRGCPPELQRRGSEPPGGDHGNRCGRAVFLVGAGCSVTAGIPLGAEVAKLCASYLAGIYESHDSGQPSRFWPVEEGAPDPEEALGWLRRNRDVPLYEVDARPDWGRYYKHFFDKHLSSINQQRTFIEWVVDKGENRLNWEHACLGELVARGYIHTVLTTNFDQLVLQGIIRTGKLPVVADGIEALNRVTAEPRRPQIVHLHGSMHTYNPRNSNVAVSETHDDPTLRSMLYTILHRCDLLVVVGYAGGEEGVMRLLIEAARQLPPLVVYWVERDFDAELSPLARELLAIGENKFRLRGTSATELFQGLMNRLRIGEPAWMTDPIGTLRRHRDEFVETSRVDHEVRQAIERFRRRVERADGHVDAAADPEDVAATLRLRGSYGGSLDALAVLGDRVAESLGLLSLRAANRLSLAEEDATEIENLTWAIDDFEAVVHRSEGAEKARWAVQLLRGLMLLYDRREGQQDDVDRIRRVLAGVEGLDGLAAEAGDESVSVDLRVFLGQAFQAMDTDGSDPEDIRTAVRHFEEASQDLRGSTDRRWADVHAGLAPSLQVLASRDGNEETARKAVSILQALVSTASGSEEDRAGRFVNLAGALMAQSELMVPHGRAELRWAQHYVLQAIKLYRAIEADPNTCLSPAIELRDALAKRLEP